MVEGEAVCARPAHRAPRNVGRVCGSRMANWQMSERTKVPIIERSSIATANSESRTCRLYKRIGDLSSGSVRGAYEWWEQRRTMVVALA